MAAFNGIITFGATAVQITSVVTDISGNAWPASYESWKVIIEPLRGNAAASWIGLSNVTNNGTGLAIQELAAPVTGLPLDRFVHYTNADRGEDAGSYWMHGTSGQKASVTIWSL